MNDDRLDPPLLEALTAVGTVRTYRRRAILFTEGDPGDGLYLLLSGRVQAYASSDEGRDIVLGEHGPGEYVGELALDGGPRVASVRAMAETRCCIVSAGQLREVVARHPEFALHVIRKLSSRLRRITEQVKTLALHDVQGRLALMLDMLSEERGGVRIVSERVTQKELAERIGASREMVSRVLKDLVTGGYVELREGHYAILRKLPAGH